MIDPSTQSTTLKPNRRLDASPAFPDH
jgi:hypothetical protein